MTALEVYDLANAGRFPGRPRPVRVVETHISWVLLAPDFAFKIKKPVLFDFLDFSTLEKRRFFCAEELRLNRRLAPDLYLDVLPVGTENGQARIGAAGEPVLDYALQMRRMDETRQMDSLLAQNRVTPQHLDQLAHLLAGFHKKSTVTADSAACSPGALWADFAGLYPETADVADLLGPRAVALLDAWRSALPAFLEKHRGRLVQRAEEGFWVEGHGDLHSRNIFLAGHPVVFDCIEFDPHLRRLDVLNELAFFCMDLEVSNRDDLSAQFLKKYRQLWEIAPAAEDFLLFTFFKAYRAGVRLKVTLLELKQHQTPALKTALRRYWALLERYCSKIIAHVE